MRAIIIAFSLFSLLIASLPAHAQNYMLVMGAGGEPVDQTTTMFDDGFKVLGSKLATSNWRYRLAVDGGHVDTEIMLNGAFPKALSRATFLPDDYHASIKFYVDKILAGQIKKGEQLIVVINTHGAEKDADKPSLTHEVSVVGGAMTDPNNLKGSTTVNLDDLKPLVDLATEKGVKLGIIDMSCHSGNSLALRSPTTCVVAATGPNHYGYTAFAESFFGNLAKGRSLEETFLKSRLETVETSFPMISTAENDAAVDRYYEAITPYLYYTDKKYDKLTPNLETHSSNVERCEQEQKLDGLVKQIDSFARTLSNGTSFDGTNLKALISSYQTAQDHVKAAIAKLGGDQLNKKVTVSFGATEFKQDWKFVLSSDIETILKNLARQERNAQSKAEKNDRRAVIKGWQEIKRKKAQLLTQYPDLARYQDARAEILKSLDESYTLAKQIAGEERKYYQARYLAARPAVPPTPATKSKAKPKKGETIPVPTAAPLNACQAIKF